MMKKIVENSFDMHSINVVCEEGLDRENILIVDLDEEIAFKFNASDKPDIPNLSDKILEFTRLKNEGLEIVIASSFHPDVVDKWKKENRLDHIFNSTTLHVPRIADIGRRNPATKELYFSKPENPIHFIETPAMTQCPRPGCDHKDSKNVDKSKEHIKNNKFDNDLEEYFFTGNHRRSNRITSYFEPYDRNFSRFREKNVSILEIGICGGGGMQMWKNYFGKNCNVYGIDIRPNSMFEEDQIRCFLGDQEDTDFLDRVIKKVGSLDVVIDDGGHSMEQQIQSFIKIWPHLNPGGVYLVEDLITSYHPNNKYGSEDRENSFISVAKNMIDEVNRTWIDHEYKGTNTIGKGFPQATDIAAIHTYSSQVFIEKLPELSKRCKGWPGEIHQVGYAVSGLPGMKNCQLSCSDGTEKTAEKNMHQHVLKNCYIKRDG